MDVMHCPVRRESDIYVTLVRARELARTLGLKLSDCARVEITVLELARNILCHAGKGHMLLKSDKQEGRSGIIIEAHDTGPGIVDVQLALQDGYSTSNTMGAGLPGVRRLMDDFEITSIVGEGTTVRVAKWQASSQFAYNVSHL